jgi:adiponectin receptor
MKVPQAVDLSSLPHLPDFLKNADLHKLQSELLTCLPSMPDLQRIRELLYNCLPGRFSSSNHTDVCVLVITLQLSACLNPVFPLRGSRSGSEVLV